MADYYICPGCGDDVKVGSAGCPKCNNLDPWEIEDTESYDGVDLPEDDDDYNYEEFKKREFGDTEISNDPKKFFWWIVAVILLIALLSYLVL